MEEAELYRRALKSTGAGIIEYMLLWSARHRPTLLNGKNVWLVIALQAAKAVTLLFVLVVGGVLRFFWPLSDGGLWSRCVKGVLRSFNEKIYRIAALTYQEIAENDHRPPVLLLRSFKDDIGMYDTESEARFGSAVFERLEQHVAKQLWQIGPVVAIGDPRDKADVLCAARVARTEGTDWQTVVRSLLKHSALIVMFVGGSGGLSWEYNEICLLQLLDKLVIVFPPVDDLNAVNRWYDFLEMSGLTPAFPGYGLTQLRRLTAIVFTGGQPHAVVGRRGREYRQFFSSLIEAQKVSKSIA